jgi:tRNA (cmo5U34)-methyltransferase
VSSSTPFSDPKAIADYEAHTLRLVPGFADMQRMAALLLAERMPPDGRVLVVGAGGGLELKAFAQSYPDWCFDGVDPSAEMLRLAERTLGPLASRVQLHQGYVHTAPSGPFDAAACLLTLHVTTMTERLSTLQEIHRRLKPGAPLVVMHLSFAQAQGQRSLWLTRYAAFAASSGVDIEKARAAAAAIDERLCILAPEQDEALLREAGFASVAVFYVGLAFRGWVAHA